MGKDLLKVGVSKEDKKIYKNFEEDKFCQILLEIFEESVIPTYLVRQLKDIKDSCLGEHTKFFLENGNMATIHSCMTNPNACKLFLKVDRGYNIAELAKSISTGKKKDARPTVRHWMGKFKKLKLVKESQSLSSSRLEVVYEKDYELGILIKLVDCVCLRNYTKSVTKETKENMGEDIIKRRFIDE